MAYCCLQDDCPLGETLFASKKALRAHELQLHSKVWDCHRCKESFESISKGERHFTDKHPELQSREEIETVLRLAERIDEKMQDQSRLKGHDCPLCKSVMTHPRSHLNRHLQNIALYAMGLFGGLVNDLDIRSSETAPHQPALGGSSSREANTEFIYFHEIFQSTLNISAISGFNPLQGQHADRGWRQSIVKALTSIYITLGLCILAGRDDWTSLL